MQKIFIWGTGLIADQILGQISVFELYEVLGFIDNSPEKKGKLFWDRKIYAPDILNDVYPNRIVILTDYYDEIRTQIISMFPNMEGIIENKYFFHKVCLLKRYETSSSLEIQRILEYIRNHDIQVFNYSYTEKYTRLNIEVFYDQGCNMYFVYHKNKKLYFARFLDTEDKVREYYRQLLVEQDAESPHRYLTSDFDISAEDVVVDAGAAEGNFSLEIIDRVCKIYMIETDEAWIEALQETFKKYKDKIIIIKKFLTSMDIGKFATLDNLINEPVNFIKMDIEGNEWDALIGAGKLIKKSDGLKCAICSYHGDSDEILIKGVMEGYGMDCSAADGYMWFPLMIRNTYVSTKLCRGIVRGIK